MNKLPYRPQLMGIINVTPDSFSDGGKYATPSEAVAKALALIEEGADVIDIGGESTRPGASSVSVDEEIGRVVPVIEALRAATDVPISIDTRHSAVMKAAIQVGATIINDIMALLGEGSFDVASASNSSVCLVHMQGEPDSMQNDPQYDNVIDDVYAFLAERVESLTAAGVSHGDIYVDVGIGFGKTLENNISLLQNLSRFKQLGTKMLLGTSNKSFIQKIANISAPEDRLPGSLASLIPGLQAEVDMFRVHDVAAARQFISVFQSIQAE